MFTLPSGMTIFCEPHELSIDRYGYVTDSNRTSYGLLQPVDRAFLADRVAEAWLHWAQESAPPERMDPPLRRPSLARRGFIPPR